MFPLLQLVPFLFVSHILGQESDCPSPMRPAFIRQPGAIRQAPIVQAKLDMVACADACRRNAHPSTEAFLPCRGFNFRVGRSPTCEFFSADAPGIVEARDYYFTFEKTCLQVPPRCEDATFVVDAKRGVRLKTTGEPTIATSQKDCIHSCLAEECPAFEWNEKTKRCLVYKKTRRELEAVRAEDVLYMENNCIAPSSRCPNERIDFLLARKSDVPSFGVSVGIRSLRACMNECVETTLFFCRSFQLDPITSECFVSDESSEEAVPSKKLDLYEPFCSPETADVTCSRPYAYEKILTTKMMGARQLSSQGNVGPEECLGLCSSLNGCHAVNYDVSRRTCHLLDRQRPQGSIGPDENFDFYEGGCPPSTETTSLTPIPEFHLVAGDKTIARKLLHASHTDVRSLEECYGHCKRAGFGCRSFSFSSTARRCLLSAAIISGEKEQSETEHESKVYALDDQSVDENVLDEATTRYPTLVSVVAQVETSSEQNHIFHMSSKELEELTATTNEPRDTTSTASAHVPTLLRAAVSQQTHSLEVELELLEPGAMPRMVSTQPDLGFVNPNSISVEAECFDNGVNITFDTAEVNYTGAVYATERFEQCRVLVKNSQRFAIFVPRPSHNTWCNALEVEGQLSVVLVMSNDRVWPLDVTTARDLFYHISCNYSQSETLHRGIVVGGPSPVAVSPEAVRHSISLQISRGKGNPISHAYIGESLIVRVDSSIPAEELRVVDCTAHRVGSTTGSVHLIADGCALLPSLMSSMVLSPRGWEATLSAFRVDDSEQVDIACMVTVCAPGKCNHQTCPPAPRAARSLSSQEAVRIDTRLNVLGNSTLSQERGPLPAICVQPSIYISILFMLIVFAFAALISLVAALKSKRRSSRGISDAL